MSANDDIILDEVPESAEGAAVEPDAITPDVTPRPRGYQNLFRAVCLKTRGGAPDSA